MKWIYYCRRTFIAFYSVSLLAILAYTKGIDTSMAISSIVIALAGANAYERKQDKDQKLRDNPNYNR